MTARSIWGRDDCFTWLAPAGAARPDWLRDCRTEAEALRAAVAQFGSLMLAYEGLAREFGLRRARRPLRPGDRTFGHDRSHGVVGAVVQADGTEMIRTHAGAAVADWKQRISIWRGAD